MISHGLKESTGTAAEERKKEDEEELVNLLHAINCDEVSVQTAIRLGRKSGEHDAKLRPVKLVVSSESQKEKVLTRAKNLRLLKDRSLDKVFVHQDLTPKQRLQRTRQGAKATTKERRKESVHRTREDSNKERLNSQGGLSAGCNIKLKCWYTNANSLVGKMSEFRERTAGKDIIGVTETWANEGINDAELAIDGYNLFRRDRGTGRGGALILYVNERLLAAEDTAPTLSNLKEALWCNVETQGRKLLVGLCYRSPSSCDANDESLIDMLEIGGY